VLPVLATAVNCLTHMFVDIWPMHECESAFVDMFGTFFEFIASI